MNARRGGDGCAISYDEAIAFVATMVRAGGNANATTFARVSAVYDELAAKYAPQTHRKRKPDDERAEKRAASAPGVAQGKPAANVTRRRVKPVKPRVVIGDEMRSEHRICRECGLKFPAALMIGSRCGRCYAGRRMRALFPHLEWFGEESEVEA